MAPSEKFEELTKFSELCDKTFDIDLNLCGHTDSVKKKQTQSVWQAIK